MLETFKARFDKNDLFVRVVATYLNKYEKLVTKDIIEEIILAKQKKTTQMSIS